MTSSPRSGKLSLRSCAGVVPWMVTLCEGVAESLGRLPPRSVAKEHEVADPHEAEKGADRCRHERALGVVDDLRRDETQPPPARLDVDRARREHVAHPLAVSAVGQGDDVAVAVAEEVDRRVADAAGGAPDVRDDREAGKPGSERPEDTVRDVKVEPREGLGQRHRMRVSRMMGGSDPRPRAPGWARGRWRPPPLAWGSQPRARWPVRIQPPTAPASTT